MTLTALADQLNTTTMTIYRRLKRNGLSIDELRNATTGELTPAGVSTIAALFDATGGTSTEPAAEHGATHETEQGATGGTGDALAVAVLEAKLEGAAALIEQLTGERDELRRQLATALAALAAEQADRQQERRLLTGAAADPGDPRPSVFQTDVGRDNNTQKNWLFRLFRKS